VAVPIRISAPEEAADTSPLLANAITVAIRESVFGNLLIEMDRVAAEAERSYVFFKGADGAEEADSVVNEPQQAPVSRFRALFWLEGAYIGAFPFPDNGVVNGARWGAVACPIPHVAPSLHIGWMGMRDASNAVGSVASSMIPVEAAVRIVIPVGMSHISLAPTLRLDLSISSLRPEDEERDTAFDVALLLGGMTYWSVPLPKDRMELVFGAGLMATVIGTDIEIDDQIVLEKSPFSVVWTAGLGWSL
jgi:hypothetical protein